jgi:hypothetical protein
MLGSLQLFNALVVRVKQEPEGYCSVLDILVSLTSIGRRSRRRPIPSKSQTELASENFQIMLRDDLAVVGLTDFF